MASDTAAYGVDIEKLDVKHQHLENGENDNVGTAYQTDEASLPPGYFRSSFFLGSMTAIGLGLMAGVAGFGYAAPILGVINEDIGPVEYPLQVYISVSNSE